MNVIERIKGVFSRRSGPNPTMGQLNQWIYGAPAISGVAVSEESAIGLTAFYRGVDLISSTIASLDGSVIREDDKGRRTNLPRHMVSMLLDDPTELINKFKFFKTLIFQTVCSGNGYAEIERDELDRPIGLHLLHWRNVLRPEVTGDDVVLYHVRGAARPIPARDMIHLTITSWDGINGISPVQANREALGLSMAEERHAGAVMGNGARPGGFLKSAKANMSPETKNSIREIWENIHKGVDKSGKIGILPADLEWVESNMTPADAELLLSRKFGIEQVSRVLGVPPNLLFSGEAGSYNSNAEANLQFYQLGLRALIENLESEYDHKLLSRAERMQGFRVKFDITSILRGDFRTSADAWRTLWLSGLCSRNEGRSAIGLNPLEGPEGDDILTPANMLINGELPADPGAEPPDQELSALSAPMPTKQLEDLRSSSEPLEVRAAQLAVSLEIQRATRAALVSEIDRGLRRQARSKPSPEEHRSYLLGALEPSLAAYRAAHGLGPEATATALADRWAALTAAKGPEAEGLSEEILATIGGSNHATGN